ncbi:zinc metalloproteinase nas-4-like [Onthophagus taurus]|uniref:zinc metalloproteinase nas-4-like n=1 Tax=Onthophagus taurus TaxID=166361 RepID=UPI0039BDF7B7
MFVSKRLCFLLFLESIILAISVVFETQPNYKAGDLLDNWDSTLPSNPDEVGNYYQGDILINVDGLRSMVSDPIFLWPGGVVPYQIVGPYNEEGTEMIKWAINEFVNKTCIKLRPKENEDTDYLVFTNNKTGCWSYVGKQGGKQEINLQHPACVRKDRRGTILHEIMHALGFVHEHTRPDRDKYIDVLWDNINQAMRDNFNKTPDDLVSSHEISYDYGSLMQYSMYAFSTKGYNKPTLRPKFSSILYNEPNQSFKLGQRTYFSEKDLQKIKILYCSEHNS